MSSSQVKLLIEPSPKAHTQGSFIQGFPGIPPSQTRPPARIAGVVHVRAPPKGIQAAWLRIELRKNESIPPGDHWAELIGRAPIDLWTAPGVDPRVAHATANKGARGKMEPAEEPEDWETLKDSSYPFVIPIPEGLPPSARIDKQSAITYDLVASLCIQTKRGILKKEFHSSVVQAIQLIVIEKHELHSMHPIYHVADEHTASTAPSPPNEPTSIVSAKVYRSQSCYGPGDTVNVRIIVSSDRISAVKLRNISFAVRETITFRGGSGGTTRSGAPTTSDSDSASTSAIAAAASSALETSSAAILAPASVQRTEVIASKSKSIGKKMYKGDKLMFDLSAPIPKTHSLMSVATAKHIGVSYTMRVVVDLGGGDKASTGSALLNAGKENAGSIVMDHLPMTLTNFLRSVSEDIVRNIGHVDGLSAGGAGGAVGLLRGGPDDPLYAGVGGPEGDGDANGGGGYPPSDYGGGHPGALRRSRSIDGSSSSLSGLPPISPTTPTSAHALRRSDTLFSQRTAGTNFSGPGLAGRGVPGQLFHWSGAAGGGPSGPQQAEPVRTSAFVSGPGSIYHGRSAHSTAGGAGANVPPPSNSASWDAFNLPNAVAAQLGVRPARKSSGTEGGESTPTAGGRALNQAELNALFHHTDRADSAAEMLGLDPALFVNDLASYSGFRAGQKIRAGGGGAGAQGGPGGPGGPQQGSPRTLAQLVENPNSIPPSAPGSVYSGGSNVTRPPSMAGGIPPSVAGGGAYRAPPSRLIPAALTAAEQQAERVRVQREQAAMSHQAQFQAPPSSSQQGGGMGQGTPPSAYGGNAAATPTHQRNVSTPVIRGPGIALHPGYQSKPGPASKMSSPAGGGSTLRPSPSPAPSSSQNSPQSSHAGQQQQHTFSSAEDEKRMLYERARAEAEQFQANIPASASFPPRNASSLQQEGYGRGGEREELMDSKASQAAPSYAATPAPAPAPATAAMDARPQSMMELSGSRVPVGTSPLYVAMNPQNAPQEEQQQNSSVRSSGVHALPVPPAMFTGVGTSAESEKEQMRLFYEARDAVERYQAGSASGSGNGAGTSDAGASGGSSSVLGPAAAAGGSYAAGAGTGENEQGSTSLQRHNTAFFEPYETAPVPSYGKVVEEDRQQQQISNPLLASMYDPQLSQAMEENERQSSNLGPAAAVGSEMSSSPTFRSNEAQASGPPPPAPSSVTSQGMPKSRPPPLPLSLIGAGGSSHSAFGAATSSVSDSNNGFAGPPPRPGQISAGLGQPQPSPAPSAMSMSVPQLPQFGLFSPISFTMPPPPLVGGGDVALAGAGGSTLSRAPTMPRRAFEEENYTDAAQSASAVPPPRPPKAASVIMHL
ncbi:hypothetical protein CF326_g3100 [Tilletia indica]|nr:hypothetical protein CF326_g3100 [Tilletia indica]